METKNLVLWGHSLQDYQEMFDLTQEDLNKKIIDCGAGPASFNAEMSLIGRKVISCDSLYQLSKKEIQQQIENEFASMLALVKENEQLFVWQQIKSLDDLTKIRRAGVNQFLLDFEQGKQQDRYCAQSLDDLQFEDFSFDLALCSHYLFFHHQTTNLDFHLTAIKEMCRVAHEVRIFPLIDSQGEISELVGPIMLALQQENYRVEILEVPYQFQKKGNAMMRVYALSCDL